MSLGMDFGISKTYAKPGIPLSPLPADLDVEVSATPSAPCLPAHHAHQAQQAHQAHHVWSVSPQ